MSRSRPRGSGLWITVFVVAFLIMAGGATLTYMATVKPQIGIEAEVEAGGEMAGINLPYPVSRPLTVRVWFRVEPPSLVGPAYIRLYLDGAEWKNLVCGTVERRRFLPPLPYYSCTITIPVEELGPGRHLVEVSVTGVAVKDRQHLLDPEGRKVLDLLVWVEPPTTAGGYMKSWIILEIRRYPLTVILSTMTAIPLPR